MEDLSKYVDLISGIIGFILGIGATVTFQKITVGKKGTMSDQRGSTVGRDQAGRDINR